MKSTDENYEKLAVAIVKQAVIDYRKGNVETRKSIERFFRSEWFYTLTEVDGEILIKKLHNERKVKDE